MALSEQAAFLRDQVRVFGLLPEDELNALESRAELLWLPPRRTIIVRGELLTRFYVLKSGCAAARYRAPGGHVELLLREGDFFGERCLFPEQVSDASIRTTEEAFLLAFAEAEARRVFDVYPAARESLALELSLRRKALEAAAVIRKPPQPRPDSSPSLS